MDCIALGKRVIEGEIDELRRLAERVDGAFVRAVETLKRVVESGRKIVVVGVGKSNNIGHKIAATLNSTGATAVVLHSQNALHGDLGLIQNGDAILALSQSGETRELLDLLPYVRRFDVSVIGLTGDVGSSLARHCDVVLDTHVEREACPLNLAPTSSTTVMLVLGDALAMVLLEARGFRQEDFARLHPSGRLGRLLLTRVRDVMRGADRMAVVAPETSVEEALRAMTQRRSGAAVVVDSLGRLAGIFTHGDFARAFQREPDIRRRPVSAFMTAQPVTIPGDRLASETLAVLETHAVDELLVVDADGRPIGLIDTQDLSRMKLL